MSNGKIQLIETFSDLNTSPNMLSEDFNEEMTTKSKEKLKRVDGKYIIGMIEGEFFKPDGMSRNRRFYSRNLWENVLKNPDIQNQFISSNMFGEIGHSDGPIDDFVLRRGEASHFIDELWIDPKNKGMGRAYILNTPVGQFLKTYMGAGCKLKVSTRGAGTFAEGKTYEGVPIIDESTYELQTVDFVVHPGFLETNPVLRESYEKATHLKINTNNYSITENTKTKGENTMTDQMQTFVEDLKTEKSELKTDNKVLSESLREAEKGLVIATSQVERLTESYNALEVEKANLQETLQNAEKQVTELKESLTCYEEKAGTIEQLDEATSLATKAVLSLSKYQELGSIKELKEMKELLTKAVKQLKEGKELNKVANKMFVQLKETKDLEKSSKKAYTLLKEYLELGTLAELKELKETATKIVTCRIEKKTTNEAIELSQQYSCPVETVSKLIKKYGLIEAKETLQELLKENSKTAPISNMKSLLKEEMPKEEPADKFLKPGLLQDLKAADFNKEALGDQSTMELMDVKPLNPYINKLSSEYGKDFIGMKKDAGEIKVDNEPIAPEEAEKAAKAIMK